MNLNCNNRTGYRVAINGVTKSALKFVPLLVLFFGSLLSLDESLAEPYLAFRTNNKCSACHVNPIGGGARNQFGNFYGNNVLPAKSGDSALFDPGKLSETFRIGADIRANYNYQSQDESDSQGFETQSAQIYMHFQPKGSRFSFYLDEQVAPGAALNREAFVLSRLGNTHYIKAGKIMLPYGLRLEDDGAFIRQATQITFDNSDNGVELGLEFNKATVNLVVTNGTGAAVNDDEGLQYLVRGEWLGSGWRIGSNALYNDSDAGTRELYGVFAGLNFYGFSLLAELDSISDESIAGADGEGLEQEVGFIELNRLFSKGLNLKLTYEVFDPDSNVDENQRTRTSFVAEYTPVSNFQIRSGIRIGDDIPQREEGNFDSFFAQAHFYF